MARFGAVAAELLGVGDAPPPSAPVQPCFAAPAFPTVAFYISFFLLQHIVCILTASSASQPSGIRRQMSRLSVSVRSGGKWQLVFGKLQSCANCWCPMAGLLDRFLRFKQEKLEEAEWRNSSLFAEGFCTPARRSGAQPDATQWVKWSEVNGGLSALALAANSQRRCTSSGPQPRTDRTGQ